MKQVFERASALILSLGILLSVLSACSAKEMENDTDAIASVAVLDSVIMTPFVTLVDDGREITVENTAGKTFRQLLNQARIKLEDGDLLTLLPEQKLEDTLVVCVLHKCTVEIVLSAEESAEQPRYVLTMMGGTVGDALEAAGIQLEENQTVNYELDEELKDGMEILISLKLIEETEPTETEATQPAPTTAPSVSKPSASKPKPSNPKPTEPKPTTPKPTDPKPSETKPTEPKPTEPKPTEPKPTEPKKTVVSVEVYEDCDGSGHGVKVITYSDGTQEEVYF